MNFSAAMLAFLAALGCHPKAVIVEGAAKSHYENGVIYLAPHADDGVLIHEAWHACQYQRRGPAKNETEWEAREAEARKVELMWRWR